MAEHRYSSRGLPEEPKDVVEMQEMLCSTEVTPLRNGDVQLINDS